MYVPAQNVTDTQIVIDADGRTLGGGEWGAVDRHDPVAQAAIGDSRIAIHPDLDPKAADVSDEARAACEHAEALEARRLELANLTSDRLETLADVAGIHVDEPGLLPDQMDPMRRKLARRLDVALTAEPLAEPDLAAEASAGDDHDGDEDEGGAPAIPAAAAKKAAAPRRGGDK